VLTRARTAATTAVATDALANPDATTLGLIGAGRLAIEHVTALRHIRPIEKVWVWSRSVETLDTFRSAVGDGVEVEFATDPRHVVESADVVCTLTPSREPIVSGDWFRPGLHLNAVGAPPRADHREIDATGMARATVFVDSTATQLAKSGDALLSIAEGATTEDHFRRELGAVLVGRDPGRTHHDQITLFNSVGLALQDLAYAALCLERADQLGLGTTVRLSASPALAGAR
jgi:ornithine cyclodeaminase/alanine dehydrogenase